MKIDYVYVTISFVLPTDKPISFKTTTVDVNAKPSVTRIVTGVDGGTTIISEAAQTDAPILTVPDRLKSSGYSKQILFNNNIRNKNVNLVV